MKLSQDVRTELRPFAFYLANHTLAMDVLPATMNYSEIFEDPSALEQLFAVWSNVLELDEQARVTNAEFASRRAAQYIRSYVDSSYSVEPAFDEWELKLSL